MSQTDQDKASAAHGKIIARAWRDPAFKAKLQADPHATLKEAAPRSAQTRGGYV